VHTVTVPVPAGIIMNQIHDGKDLGSYIIM